MFLCFNHFLLGVLPKAIRQDKETTDTKKKKKKKNWKEIKESSLIIDDMNILKGPQKQWTTKEFIKHGLGL